jgi:hypothetical protein
VLESMGSLFESLQVVSKADKLELGHPIVRENLIRIYQKLGEKIKI